MLEATTLESSLGAVAAKCGLSFTAESVVGLFTARGVAFRPLVTTAPAPQVGVTWRRDATSKAVRRFLAVIDELAQGAGPLNGITGPTATTATGKARLA